MLNRLLPDPYDARYRGHKAAVWIFVPIVFMKLALGLVHIFSADGGAQSVSTIPLDTYPAGAAQNVVAMFARLGLEQLFVGAVLLLVLVRHRALLPLMYALLVMYELARRGIAAMKPLAVAGPSGAATPALVIAVLSATGLVLSLSSRTRRADPTPRP
jgi:hypothetical protein